MIINHAGVVNRDSAAAERFYRDFLGLPKIKDWVIPSELSGQLFSVSKAMRLISFGLGDQKIEVFIWPGHRQEFPVISHFGLIIDNFEQFIEKAEEYQVEVISGGHDGKQVWFVKDYAGNMIEIKPAS